ncbi:MAG: SpoIIE family protein phosphatase [Gammaproteobacteria bacterium]|nr:SpoIIE family protein phosphatase [Gammaproteobacteria bacterium]MCP5195362.1 SpoIIE family protein phosphatase [Gammaproteobacteria bacterium]
MIEPNWPNNTRFSGRDDATHQPLATVGAVTRPIASDALCGDVCAWWWRNQNLYLSLADGLGHGEFAREAALAAMASAQRQPADTSLSDIIARCDDDLRATRGVAIGLAVVDATAQTVSFCGVGNIRALLINATQHRRFICGYGIVGAGFKNLFIDTQQFFPGDILMMASDGLPEHFVVSDPLSESSCSAQQLAEALLQEWAVETDDAAVLVYRAPAC